MPELPEVETVRRGLQPAMEGAHVTAIEQRRPDLRFPFPDDFPTRMTDRDIVSVDRRAKYLLLHLDNGDVLICHLGMSGSFRIEETGGCEEADGSAMPGHFHYARSKDEKHDHVVFHLRGADGVPRRVVFNDPRRFGFMLMARADALEVHPLLAGLGVEPTGNALDGRMLADLLRDRRSPLKAALMDQRLIAGLGNIYVCEALWRAQLSPKRIAGSIAGRPGTTPERCRRLAEAIRSVIAEAVEAGGSSLRDYMRADGSLGYFQHSFKVYDREGEACQRPGCGGTIRRIVQSGRSTFHCPTCQR